MDNQNSTQDELKLYAINSIKQLIWNMKSASETANRTILNLSADEVKFKDVGSQITALKFLLIDSTEAAQQAMDSYMTYVKNSKNVAEKMNV